MTADAKRPDSERRWAELVEAAEYGELSDAERSELERLTSETEERRHEQLLLAAIGRSPPLDPELSEGDERLIDAVLAQHRQLRRRRRAVVWLAAAALLVPLAAMAAYLPRLMKAGQTAVEGAPAPAPSADTRTGDRTQPDQVEPESEEPRRVPETISENHVVSPAPSASHSPPSPAELLERAQRARSTRDYRAAMVAYQQLLRLYPKSTVAPLARISLAQLQLAQGDASSALSGFEAYERSGGALSQEAHFGKIQALRALGRSAEERSEIRRFLARYPDSVQAAALKQRLGDGGGPE